MEVVEDCESRPRKNGYVSGGETREVKELRELKMLKTMPGYSGGKLIARKKQG